MKRILAAMLTALMLLTLLPLASAPARAEFDFSVQATVTHAYVGEDFFWLVHQLEGTSTYYLFAFEIYRDGQCIKSDPDFDDDSWRPFIPTSPGKYKARVCVMDDQGNSKTKESPEITVSPQLNTFIKVEPLGATSLKITWNKIPGVTQYYLYRSTNRKTGWAEIMYSVDSPPPACYIDTRLKAGTRYFYKVCYDRPGAMGPFSPVAAGVPMAKTRITSITSPSARRIRMTWARAAGASGYQVAMATSANGSYRTVRIVTGGTTAIFSGVRSGSALFFKVRPYRRIYTTTYWGQYSAYRSIRVK
ncbi:MAG: fibronectin type III domain-containing protein [Bacillota bacterium]|nr:fibronectin type III domain-containing protein [Bacillota bacterium]